MSIVPVPCVVFPLVIFVAILSLLVDFAVSKQICYGGVCFGLPVVLLGVV